MSLIKAAREALEALNYVEPVHQDCELICDAITTLRAAIAEAEKAEPVGKVVEWRGPNSTKEHGFLLVRVIPNKGEVLYPYLGTLLYTHPTPPKWQPIETAPKSTADGRHVAGIMLLGFVPDAQLTEDQSQIDIIWWEPLLKNHRGGKGKWVASSFGESVEVVPTHWMPLPPAPQESSQEVGVVGAADEPMPTLVGAAPLPDDVAEMVEALRCAMATDVEQMKAADMLERLARERDSFYMDYRIICDEETKRLEVQVAELEAQREGMVLVPREPTQDMLIAAWNTSRVGRCPEDDIATYRAMIAAAPKGE